MNNEARPVGPVVDFVEAKQVGDVVLHGRSLRLEPIEPARHGPAIWAHMVGHDHIWDYLYEEPPIDEAGLVSILETAKAKPDWQGYAICLPDLGPVGYAFYLNIVPGVGSIEVGNINFAPVLQRTVAATEAMFLMMQAAFEAGYRRYEWKCNALNMPSRRAAQRFGFSWEGIFRQHLIVKGRNRDTAWLAITDRDWPDLRAAFEAWLAPENFDIAGAQRQALRDLTDPLLVNRDPAQDPSV
ncbi:GNAT family protein [Octadecabacter sp. 1_MG-2023]|uniref:GNAT family N-acetyltransferase n=1 Tax=unclassified Octadecabacter TaxID=196158 RepID=UPI001C09BCE3|nr:MULTISPECIES: GNAT family protein [unclassified Octadecabacter]MBU2994657.1 GNAT family N-acetyltransferase [Octadecabacter sp. B2R22]MDO6734049.1 GNAT family protein [Octadecabacter sp. 1_MG-2023]